MLAEQSSLLHALATDAVLTALTVLAVYSLLMYGLMTEAMVSQV